MSIQHYAPQNVLAYACTMYDPADKKYLVLECPALQGVRDRYNDLFASGDHAVTMVYLIWQHDIRAVAKPIKGCMDAHGNPGH